ATSSRTAARNRYTEWRDMSWMMITSFGRERLLTERPDAQLVKGVWNIYGMRVGLRADFGSSPAEGRISEPFRFRFDSFLLAMSGRPGHSVCAIRRFAAASVPEGRSRSRHFDTIRRESSQLAPIQHGEELSISFNLFPFNTIFKKLQIVSPIIIVRIGCGLFLSTRSCDRSYHASL